MQRFNVTETQGIVHTDLTLLQRFCESVNQKESFDSDRVLPPMGKCGTVWDKTSKGRSFSNDICLLRPGVFATVRVGVVVPRDAPTGYIMFDLCQDGKCVEAGNAALFGATMEPVDNVLPIDNKNFYLLESTVNDVMIKQGWTLEKPLVAKTTSSIVGNLPQPVVILKEILDKGRYGPGNVTLSPGEKPGNYGNLLQKFAIV